MKQEIGGREIKIKKEEKTGERESERERERNKKGGRESVREREREREIEREREKEYCDYISHHTCFTLSRSSLLKFYGPKIF